MSTNEQALKPESGSEPQQQGGDLQLRIEALVRLSLGKPHIALSERIEALVRDEVKPWVKIIADEGECWYDHHDYCQAHRLDPRPCYVERAKEWLRKEV